MTHWWRATSWLLPNSNGWDCRVEWRIPSCQQKNGFSPSFIGELWHCVWLELSIKTPRLYKGKFSVWLTNGTDLPSKTSAASKPKSTPNWIGYWISLLVIQFNPHSYVLNFIANQWGGSAWMENDGMIWFPGFCWIITKQNSLPWIHQSNPPQHYQYRYISKPSKLWIYILLYLIHSFTIAVLTNSHSLSTNKSLRSPNSVSTYQQLRVYFNIIQYELCFESFNYQINSIFLVRLDSSKSGDPFFKSLQMSTNVKDQMFF